METISILLIAIALAMDAFSVSLTKGYTQKKLKNRQIIYYGLFFGIFQFIMPIIGYLAGSTITSLVSTISPWIAFILLVGIGVNMIRESLSDQEDKSTDTFTFNEVFLLAIATSIDALAVGVTFALININVLIPCIIIGVVAFLFTIIGIFIGRKLGDYFGDKFEIIGGIILILLGIKILLGY